MNRCIFRLALPVVALFALSSCGGGGGGGGGGSDFVGAATVAIKDQPSQIDTGSRTLVTTEVMNIHEKGVLLKFRFPTGLSYVRDSAEIEVSGGQTVDAAPGSMGEEGAYKYIVFFLDDNDMGIDNYGTISFELRADEIVEEGSIDVDADVNDPQVPDESEFNLENPEFSAADSCSIEVTG